jgi:hypothetical protein
LELPKSLGNEDEDPSEESAPGAIERTTVPSNLTIGASSYLFYWAQMPVGLRYLNPSTLLTAKYILKSQMLCYWSR